MKLTKQQESEVMPIYKEWWHSYLNGDVKTYDHYLDDEFRFVGSTEAEAFLSRKDTTKFFEATADQIAGKSQLRNSKLTAEYYSGIVFITELADAYLLSSDEWFFYGRFRFTSMLKKNEDGWRFIYQHFSTTDTKAQEGETIGLEKVSKENQELRDVIKRHTIELQNKNRELKIESALERVRARTMAMQNSNELQETAAVLFHEFKKLGTDDIYQVTIGIYNEEEGFIDFRVTNWAGSGELENRSFSLNINEPTVLHPTVEAWKANKKSLVIDLTGETLERWLSFRNKMSGTTVSSTDTDGRRVISIAYYSKGHLSISTPVPVTTEILHTLERFAVVFDTTYTRFLDLQKAETQVREAQIQLSLERVRARSMAMQSSDELHDVLSVLFRQFDSLSIHPVNVFLSLFDREKRTLTYRASGKSGTRIPGKQVVEVDSMEPLRALYDKWINDNSDSVEVIYYPKEVIPELFGIFADTFAAMPEEDRMGLEDFPEGGYSMAGYTPFGYLGYDHQRQATEEEKDVLSRFCIEFTRVYQRFLDIEKAEAQAQEAQIEAALEKVRAHTMGMQSSEDLSKVASVMFEQMKNLGGDLFAFGIVLCDKQKNMVEQWHNLGNKGMIAPFSVPIDLDYIHRYRYDQWKAGEKLFSIEIPENYIAEHFDLMFELPSVKAAMEDMTTQGIQVEIPDWEIDYGASFKHGYLLVSSRKPFKEDHIFLRFAKVFDQAYTRFLDLQKAEAQAREARIEAALERVRSRSLAMHKSEELIEVDRITIQQIKALDIQLFAVGIHICHEHEPVSEAWMGDPTEVGLFGGDNQFPKVIYEHTHDSLSGLMYRGWKEGETFLVETIQGESLREHMDYMKTIVPDPAIFENAAPHDFLIYHFAYFSHGFFVFVSTSPCLDERPVFLRFAKVFEQAYTRFLDLQKAEAQAREAQIETALEKVRTRTMAMQKGEELQDVAVLLYKELIALGITNFVTCGYVEVNETIKRQFTWVTAPGGDTLGLFYLPLTGDATFDERYDAWKRQQSIFHQTVAGEVRSDHLEFAITTFNSKEAEEMVRSQFPDPTVFYCFNFSHGYLHLVTGSELKKEEELLLARFTRVFEQTYARFLDLKKAEAQAREAQIENALERVRSRTMAMQDSDELPEVANQLFTEVRALGIPAWSCGYNILADDKKTATCCMSSEGTMQTPFQLRLWGEASFDEMGDFILSDKTMLVQELGGKALEEHYAYMKSFPDLKPTFNELDRLGLSLPTYQINHLCKFTQGFILFITYEKVPDAHEIFKRFTNVFDQTYTRFLDLKKAEAQAREAIKQAALERVRGEIASMRSAKDLEIITPLVWRELTNLGIPFIRCGVFIVDDKKETVEVHLSSPDGKPLAAMNLAFDANNLTLHAVEAWKKNSVHMQEWGKSDFINYGKLMVAQGQVKDLKSYQGDAAAPESLYLHFIPFSQGLLYVGSLQPLHEEAIQLVTLLAKSFAIAYARYEDFVKLEQAKAEVESAMTELKATQSQLVQQEKLASLGQLTAGIAHEIKNPLNFVNNFSEVSIELIEEARDELESVETSHDLSLQTISELLDDVQSNLTKIHEHGSRANGIVSSMLQHSRGGSGKMEPTDLNALIKEYVYLSYHGMRAGKNPIDVDIQLNLDDLIGDVPLIIEDFSRVILNICNNAFDAMRTVETQHAASLRVRTKKSGDAITIEIEDNGPGIPDEIKDKILQPFFTTKKGTEGTGLGLSITHDIVKGHGGELKVKSKKGEGSEFIIQLPIIQNQVNPLII